MVTVLTLEDVQAREQQVHAAIRQLSEQVTELQNAVKALQEQGES